MSVLAIDYGERWLGLAISDPENRLALRYATIDQKQKNSLEELKRVVLKEKIEKILVGVPMGLDGNETEQTHTCLEFIEKLRGELSEIEIEGVDETLSSVEAAANLDRELSGQGAEHEEAARIMLTDFLRNSVI